MSFSGGMRIWELVDGISRLEIRLWLNDSKDEVKKILVKESCTIINAMRCCSLKTEKKSGNIYLN